MQVQTTEVEARAALDPRSPSLMREVNADLRRLSGAYDTVHPIAFFCECAADECYAVVWLTAAAFDSRAVRAKDGWLVVQGHSNGGAS